MKQRTISRAYRKDGLMLIPDIRSLTNAHWLMQHTKDVAYLEILQVLEDEGKIIEGTERFERYYTREDMEKDIENGLIIFTTGTDGVTP